MATSNLTIRFATAAVMVPLLLALLFWGPAWGWLVLMLVCGAVGTVELFAMTHPGDRVSAVVGIALVSAMQLAIYFRDDEPRALITVVVLVAFAGILLTLTRLGDLQTAALRLVAACFAPLWLGAGVGALARIRVEGEPEGGGFVVLALALAWLSDTGAYFAGRFLGKHKLYEAVSPKKTVEGALGGVAGGIAGALFFRWLLLRSMPLGHALLLGGVASALGQLGDLGESLLKRSVGVKDSGGIVPGHGGMLDRVDAVLITAPLTLLYLIWR
jgi:phosphatidate cytidylyltransferase